MLQISRPVLAIGLLAVEGQRSTPERRDRERDQGTTDQPGRAPEPDPVNDASEESFPASDPPSWPQRKQHPRR